MATMKVTEVSVCEIYQYCHSDHEYVRILPILFSQRPQPPELSSCTTIEYHNLISQELEVVPAVGGTRMIMLTAASINLLDSSGDADYDFGGGNTRPAPRYQWPVVNVIMLQRKCRQSHCAVTSWFPTTPGFIRRQKRDSKCQKAATVAVYMKESVAIQVVSLNHKTNWWPFWLKVS